jgi:PhnB protein
MTTALGHVRHGFGAVRPYVHGHLAMWDLVRDAFGAIEVERHDSGRPPFTSKPASATP